MKVLYFDCFSGISGDMSIAALLDLGVDVDKFKQNIFKLAFLPEGINLQVNETIKKGVKAKTFEVIEKHPSSSHCHFETIQNNINNSQIPERVKSTALDIFSAIAVAESKIHGVPIDKVHFHEVGAIDSIIDIIGISILIDELKPDIIYSSPIRLGYGSIHCQHGIYPTPAMATLEILRQIPIEGGKEKAELTTPTGAAIIKVLAHDYLQSLPKMKVKKIGYGAGKRDLENSPNVLRVIFGELEV